MKHERNYHLRDTSLKALCEQTDKRHSAAQPPKHRFKHQAFIAKHTLYIYGGTSIPCNDPQDSALDLHCYDLSRGTHKWEKIRLKCNSKDLELVSGQCGALRDDDWFMFGGSNCDLKCNNYLWRLNLKSQQIHKIDGIGQVPPPRQSASMFVNDNWLLVYGGVNTNAIEIYNTFHFFNTDSRVWIKSTGNYLFLIQPRYDSSLCQQQQRIYLFGGTYRDVANQEMYLNDFYEITAIAPTPSSICAITARRIISQNMPEPRSGHCLTAVGEDYILLVGGQNSKKAKQTSSFQGVSIVSSSWVYSIKVNSWVRLFLSQFKYRTQFTCCVDQNKVYIFGGMHSYAQLLNDLVQFSLPSEELVKISAPTKECQICDVKKHLNPRPTIISSYLIQDLADNIQFPFAAVGLLIDNAIHNYATLINLHYFQAQINKQKQYILKIEDNSKLPWNQDELISSMVSFNMDSVQIPSGVDKKTKSAILRDSLRRQYGDNAKLASLRLGSGFLHVSSSENEELVRVFLFKKQRKANKERYIVKYYTFDRKSLQLIDPRMKTAKQDIDGQYKELIDSAMSKHYMRNFIFILEPKISNFVAKNEESKQLKAHETYNDIIYGSTTQYNALEAAGYNIAECVDVSLRAYLICLYLKNQTTTITLSIKNAEATVIPTQMYLQRVDKLCRHKYVLELNNMIEYQFKIVEMYYLYDLRKKMNYFSNGLLIYHKNRLITRYKYKLGELIFRKFYKMHNNHNFLRLFGFIELPDHVPVNAFKTNVLHPAILQKLSARIKLIEKVFKKQLLQLEAQDQIKRIAPTRQSNQEIAQDIQENQGQRSVNMRRERRRNNWQGMNIDRPARPQRKRKRNSIFMAEEGIEADDDSAGQVHPENSNPQPKDISPQIMGLEEGMRLNPEKRSKDDSRSQNGLPKNVEVIEEEKEQQCQIKIVLPKIHLNGNNKQQEQNQQENSGSQWKAEKFDAFFPDSRLNYAQIADSGEPHSKVSFPIKIIKMNISRRHNEGMELENGSRAAAIVQKGLSPKQSANQAQKGAAAGKDNQEDNNDEEVQHIEKTMRQ